MRLIIILIAVGATASTSYAQSEHEQVMFSKGMKSKAGEEVPSAKSLKSGGGGCKCVGDTEYIFNRDEMTWINHYQEAKSVSSWCGCHE